MQGSSEVHITNYVWSFGDGSDNVNVSGYSSAKIQKHTFKKARLYVVQVIAYNSMGSAETSVKVWVQGNRAVYKTI